MNTNHLPRRAILGEFPSSGLFLCSEGQTHTNTITRTPWFWTSKCHGKLLAMAEKLLGMTFSCTKWKIKALKWLGFTDLNKLAHNINSAKTCFPLPEGLTRAKEKKNRINDWANKILQLKTNNFSNRRVWLVRFLFPNWMQTTWYFQENFLFVFYIIMRTYARAENEMHIMRTYACAKDQMSKSCTTWSALTKCTSWRNY